MGAGRSGSTPAVQGLHRSHPPKTRGSGLPREPSTLRQLPSPEGPQQTPPPPQPAFPRPPRSDPGRSLSLRTLTALGLPAPSDPGHSQFPGPPALPSRAAPGIPGFLCSLAPKLCWVRIPKSPGPRTKSLPVTPGHPPPPPQDPVRSRLPRGFTPHRPPLSAPDPSSGTSQEISRPETLGSGPSLSHQPELRRGEPGHSPTSPVSANSPQPPPPPPPWPRPDPAHSPRPLLLASASRAPRWSFRPATAPRPQARDTGTHLTLPPTNSSATASTSAASSHQAPPPPP